MSALKKVRRETEAVERRSRLQVRQRESLLPTSLGRLLLEKTLRGQERWRCLEIQLRMLSQSTVPLGGGPSSLCNSTSCFWARTALPSSIRSSCTGRGAHRARTPGRGRAGFTATAANRQATSFNAQPQEQTQALGHCCVPLTDVVV